MDKNKVTIIMPVYNAGNYLRAALDSIESQSYNNIELIIVDDCSTDNSSLIIEEYAIMYPNITYIKQNQNGGQSKARNRAMQYASGEFVYFMDSDDILPTNAIATLVSEISSDEYDFVIGDVRTLGTEIKSLYSTCCKTPEILNTNAEIVKRYSNIGWCVAPWAKLFRKKFLNDNNISFKEGIILEDELFTFTYVYYSQKAKIIPNVVYDYYIRSNSTMTQQFSIKHLNGMKGDIEGMKSILNNNYSNPLTSCIIIMAFRLAEAILLGNFDDNNKKHYLMFLKSEITLPIILNSMKQGFRQSVKALMFIFPSSIWLFYIKLLGIA